MGQQLDEIDQRILYELMQDARNVSAPMIAEDLSVTPGTIRNRIDRLEEQGIIKGYTARIDFERANSRLTALYMCTVPADDRERLAAEIRKISGVVNVRILMAGRRDLHVVAVGENTKDLQRIARALSELDIEIEDEELLQTELHSPYERFNPEDTLPAADQYETMGDTAGLVRIAVREDAPVAGRTIADARENGSIEEDWTIISVHRDEKTIMPDGSLTLQPDDIVTVLPQGAAKQHVFQAFVGGDGVEMAHAEDGSVGRP